MELSFIIIVLLGFNFWAYHFRPKLYNSANITSLQQCSHIQGRYVTISYQICVLHLLVLWDANSNHCQMR